MKDKEATLSEVNSETDENKRQNVFKDIQARLSFVAQKKNSRFEHSLLR